MWFPQATRKGVCKGGDALVAQQAGPLRKRLACFTEDNPSVVLLGGETIYRNCRYCGWLTSAGWGYGWEELYGGAYEHEVADERVPGRVPGSGVALVTATCAPAMASPTNICTAEPTSTKWRTNASRASCKAVRSTTLR